MSADLDLYTDASVMGERLPKGYIQDRRRVGMTFIAWAGWHGCALPERPTFAGTAYVGEHGTQRAEFYAVIHGVAAALAYVRALAPHRRPSRIVARLDNATVHGVMAGTQQPTDLRPHHATASGMCAELNALGVTVEWQHAADSEPGLRIVHRMTRLAPDQVLVDKAWRPADDDRPPLPPALRPPP